PAHDVSPLPVRVLLGVHGQVPYHRYLHQPQGGGPSLLSSIPCIVHEHAVGRVKERWCFLTRVVFLLCWCIAVELKSSVLCGGLFVPLLCVYDMYVSVFIILVLL